MQAQVLHHFWEPDPMRVARGHKLSILDWFHLVGLESVARATLIASLPAGSYTTEGKSLT
jgi:hypothetical protein